MQSCKGIDCTKMYEFCYCALKYSAFTRPITLKNSTVVKIHKSYLVEVKAVFENINHGPYYGEKRLKKSILFKTNKYCETLGDHNFFLNN